MLLLLAINAAVMLALPATLAWYATRRLGGEWRLVLLGAAAFIASQLVHVPFNAVMLPWLPQQTGPDAWVTWVFLGLSAGLCEESARWLALRFGVQSPRWRDAFTTGAGHGGVEAAILGGIATLSFLFAVALEDPRAAAALPDNVRTVLTTQLEPVRHALWVIPLGAVERAGALSFHVAASVVVARSVRGAWWWLPVAIVWHAVMDSGAIALVATYGFVPAEGFVLLNAVLAWGVIVGLREPPAARPVEPTHIAPPPVRRSLDPNSPAADASRYE